MVKEAKPIDDRPQCRRKRLNDKAERRRCTNKGVYVTVKMQGEGHIDVLCNRCIQEVRGEGWTVRYQLEGDNPAPVEAIK